ncbi:2,5-diamino-6-ribosylamino-4(3H)-pyrimidinone 5'-phosphate reductase [Borealophlyctis nickersoniae]|nr:2,5-diamino-6-ribosylamino-4(3H)-pyrimidinone 5'-phosphate reductase [Borealophlyctis nickersoniae]
MVLHIVPRIAEFELPVPLADLVSFYALSDAVSVDRRRPYTWSNTVSTLDGVTNFLEGQPNVSEVALAHVPGLEAAAKVDYRLLNLGWATADAVLITGQIMRDEPHAMCHIHFEDIRNYRMDVLKKTSPHPLQIIITASCDIDFSAQIFNRSDLEIMIMTTNAGKLKAERLIEEAELKDRSSGGRSKIKVVAFETTRDASCPRIDMRAALERLKMEFNVEHLDVSAGGSVIRQLVDAELMDELRATIAGQIAGPFATSGAARPHMFPHETGRARSYTSANSPLIAWKGIRTAGEHHVFYRGVYQYRHHVTS